VSIHLEQARPAPLLPLPPVALPPLPRLRAKLWELNPTVHCSVIGTCLTTRELRAAMARALGRDVGHETDHSLHAIAVGLADKRSEGSRQLHKALDRKHAGWINRLGKVRGPDAVMAAWADALAAGDIPGAYWALLTHPDLETAGFKRAFGDVHMLSHLVGAANRADIRRLATLEAENARLAEKIERQQLAMRRAAAERDETVARLERLAIGRVAGDAAPPPDTAALQALVASLQDRLATEAARREKAERQLRDARTAAQAARAATSDANAEAAALRADLSALERHTTAEDTAALPSRHVLYVGGRPSTVAQARPLIEGAGGTLSAHDGGQHDHPSLLPGLISQADLVLFPVDCVSHDAALAVKRLCRQRGRPWLALHSSGLGALLRGLIQSTEPTP
jgi:hypothetical protein